MSLVKVPASGLRAGARVQGGKRVLEGNHDVLAVLRRGCAYEMVVGVLDEMLSPLL